MIDRDSVVEIAARDTHDLRRRVLRDGSPNAQVIWDGDDLADTMHLAVPIDGRIVAISTWLVAPDPIAPPLDSIQLRGMATDPIVAGRGLGRALLDAGSSRAKAAGRERLWANARVTALGFYERAGWTTMGAIFHTAETGLPHRHVHLDLV